MDLVFMEDKSEELSAVVGVDQSIKTRRFYSGNRSRHSTSYIFVWLLIIEVMRLCNAEVGCSYSNNCPLWEHCIRHVLRLTSICMLGCLMDMYKYVKYLILH